MESCPPWELGSEFHWDGRVLHPAGEDVTSWMPSGGALFASATGALTTLARHLRRRRRLHLPSFFCMPVAAALAARAELTWYRHLPAQAPDLSTLQARPGDLVLAVNLFGRTGPGEWPAWSAEHPGVTVVEDHSHDPLSPWCRSSTAAYCVASLRKTLPIPDGALLWSPAGHSVPSPRPGLSDGAVLKHAAMALKSAWLDGRAVDKDTFRTLQQEGESKLVGSEAEALPVTRALLPLVDVWALARRRSQNARLLAALLGTGDGDRRWSVLDSSSVGGYPFHVQLLCVTEAVREGLRAHLRRHGIYAPVHWQQLATGHTSGDARAYDIAGRVLTIPTDHRYGSRDMQRVTEALLAFGPDGASASGGPGRCLGPTDRDGCQPTTA